MSQTAPQICTLEHPGFRMLGSPVFRLSEGTKLPSMIVQYDSQEAVLSLKSVAREFKIDPASADGQMLNLIEQALDFVVSIKPGDPLPTELNGGAASWEPTPQDRKAAASNVRHYLVQCVFAALGKSFTISGGTATGWEDQPQNRVLVKEAIMGATAMLERLDEPTIIAAIDTIIEEMAYIEAMRRSLTKGIDTLRAKLFKIVTDNVPMSERDAVKQVQTLAQMGIREIAVRLNEVDKMLNDLLTMLVDQGSAIANIRRHRDWLFRTNRSWTPVFSDWLSAPKHFDDFLLKVVERTYVFLAPRFMSFQQWATAESKMQKKAMEVKVW